MKRAELTPKHVLTDLFDTDFPAPIPDPQAAAEIVIQRLIDAGFEIRSRFVQETVCPVRGIRQ
jgi:hypothetical protein